MAATATPGVAGILVALLAMPGRAGAQRLPKDLGAWTAEYSISGGLRFHARSVAITAAGDVTARDTGLGDDVTGRVPADLLAALPRMLKAAGPARPVPAVPDGISQSIVVTTGGRTYELKPAPDLVAAFDTAFDAAVKDALPGSWRQAGWKLCEPVPQMSANDIDPPIDDLTFTADGTYSVTWRGGGAHTTGIPHPDLPDQRGRYRAVPSTGAIHVEFISSLTPPRDFAGDGQFSISRGQLTLKHVWLGTFAAPRRPDVCELTFVRK